MMLVYIGWIYLFCMGFLTVLMFLDGAFNFKGINKEINSEDIVFLYIVMYLLAPIFCVLLILGDD